MSMALPDKFPVGLEAVMKHGIISKILIENIIDKYGEHSNGVKEHTKVIL